jgi:alanyl-tRNA synthetase
MTSKEIRQDFLDFFQEKEHEVVKTSPLIPHADPTLLFTNAGMVQFKGVFLGQERRPYLRAASCQKCMRAGGKHSDLENVGHTARHHTFFEMLGNFSFGDYFKREAISYAWELLVERFGLPRERLWVSVYEDDDEAEKFWKELTDVAPSRIVRLGAKDNFWQMGDTGPCGPCSEILIDQGEPLGCGREGCTVGCDCDRFLELWNLVFMQFNRDGEGNLTPLPKQSIDTGMGLERICAVLQGKTNNFESDLFQPIIEEISTLTGREYGSSHDSDASMKVIADHVRAATFLLAEGLVPSNEGRGYVLRRIIRRASRHARLLDMHEPCLFRLIEAVVAVMGDVYPEIGDERQRTEKLLHIEEERFTRTIEVGMNVLDEIISGMKDGGGTVVPGEEVFKLYDTYGFPIDLARDIVMDAELEIDEEGFQRALQHQREKAGAHAAVTISDFALEAYGQSEGTEFVGYETLTAGATIRDVFRDGTLLDSLSEGEEGEVILDVTPFYGESGGQVGDKGTINSENVFLEVLDTKRPLPDRCIHVVRVKRGIVQKGMDIACTVDGDSRRATMRNHTATHLLNRALRVILGDHVKQSGSLVSPERLRFDFTHFSSVQDDELDRIEQLVNEKILENLTVMTETMSIDDALEARAVALFDEKYGDYVRVVSAGDFSKELCGGTHCTSTGEIGLFVISAEGSVASGIRRIEALTGHNAFEYLKDRKDEIDAVAAMLKTSQPVERVEKLLSDVKGLEREIQNLKTGSSTDAMSEVLEDVKELDGVKIVNTKREGLSLKELRIFADNLRDRLRSGIILVSSVKDGQASIVCMVSKDLKEKFRAGEILKKVAALAGGKGGGRDEMAQGGTRDIVKLDSALDKVYHIVQELNMD